MMRLPPCPAPISISSGYFTIQFRARATPPVLTPMQQVCREIRQMREAQDAVIERRRIDAARAVVNARYEEMARVRREYEEGANKKKQKRRANYFLYKMTESVLCEDDSFIDCISLEPLKRGDKITKMRSCGHTFAQEGLKIWLNNNQSCPICRSGFPK